MRTLNIVEVDEDALRHLMKYLCKGTHDSGGWAAACQAAARDLGRAVGDPLYVYEYMEEEGIVSPGTTETYRSCLP
jgi:hypothetical protein